MTEIKPTLEALLFTADSPLSVKQLEQIFEEVDKKTIEQAIHSMQQELLHNMHGIELAEVAGGYVLRSKAEMAKWILRAKKTVPIRLSKASMETLAIIAYRQPITKTEIEEARGVDSSGTLRALMEKKLIRISGKKQIAGRPLLYSTTKRFLEIFQLNNLESLPDISDKSTFQPELFRVEKNNPLQDAF